MSVAFRIRVALWLVAALPVAAITAQVAVAPAGSTARSAIEFSPLSPLINIYAIQYGRRLGERGVDELLLGAAYMAIRYDRGRTNAPGAIVGYRRHFTERWSAEYQLWPAYDSFYETVEKKHYNGFELWNEFRGGYTFDFRIGNTPMFANLQVLAGFALYGGNKPDSFKADTKGEEFFVAPMIFLGYRW